MKQAAGIYANLRSRGIVIGHNDVMIAAMAIENGLKLVTNNKKHFEKIADLEIESWLTQ